jgi:hypothetical protein
MTDYEPLSVASETGGRSIYQQLTGTVVVRVDESLYQARTMMSLSGDGALVYGPFKGPQQLVIRPGQLLFCRVEDAPTSAVGTSSSAFASFDGIRVDPYLHEHYRYLGVALSELRFNCDGSIERKTGVTSGIRGTFNLTNQSTEVYYPGQALIWDVRSPGDSTPLLRTEERLRGGGGGSSKWARYADDMATTAYLRPVARGGIAGEVRKTAMHYFTGRRGYGKTALDILPGRRPLPEPEDAATKVKDETMTRIMTHMIQTVGTATLVEFIQRGLVRFTTAEERAAAQRVGSTVAIKDQALMAAQLLRIADGAPPDKDHVWNIAQKLYWDYAELSRVGDESNGPELWCECPAWSERPAARRFPESLQYSSNDRGEGRALHGIALLCFALPAEKRLLTPKGGEVGGGLLAGREGEKARTSPRGALATGKAAVPFSPWRRRLRRYVPPPTLQHGSPPDRLCVIKTEHRNLVLLQQQPPPLFSPSPSLSTSAPLSLFSAHSVAPGRAAVHARVVGVLRIHPVQAGGSHGPQQPEGARERERPAMVVHNGSVEESAPDAAHRSDGRAGNYGRRSARSHSRQIECERGEAPNAHGRLGLGQP